MEKLVISPEICQLYLRKTICKRWKKDSIVNYGQRWIVHRETVFSTIKRMFDSEYVYSVN